MNICGNWKLTSEIMPPENKWVITIKGTTPITAIVIDGFWYNSNDDIIARPKYWMSLQGRICGNCNNYNPRKDAKICVKCGQHGILRPYFQDKDLPRWVQEEIPDEHIYPDEIAKLMRERKRRTAAKEVLPAGGACHGGGSKSKNKKAKSKKPSLSVLNDRLYESR